MPGHAIGLFKLQPITSLSSYLAHPCHGGVWLIISITNDAGFLRLVSYLKAICTHLHLIRVRLLINQLTHTFWLAPDGKTALALIALPGKFVHSVGTVFGAVKTLTRVMCMHYVKIKVKNKHRGRQERPINEMVLTLDPGWLIRQWLPPTMQARLYGSELNMRRIGLWVM